MNLAMITVIGRCVGAGDFEQAEYYTKKMMKLTYLISGLCCLGVILTMPLTMRLYGLSEETLKLAAVLVLIHDGCAIILWPASFTLTNVLRAANDVKFPMCISILSMVIVRLGVSAGRRPRDGSRRRVVRHDTGLGGSCDLFCGTVPERKMEDVLSGGVRREMRDGAKQTEEIAL